MPQEVQRDPVQVVVERLLETDQARSVLAGFQDLLDKAGNAIDPRYRVVQQPRPRPKPRPVVPQVDPVAQARAILHFGPTDQLSERAITERRRALAAVCHPDKGGSTESMQRVNTAADLLLQQLK